MDVTITLMRAALVGGVGIKGRLSSGENGERGNGESTYNQHFEDVFLESSQKNGAVARMLEVAGEKCGLSFFFSPRVENGDISTCLLSSGNVAEKENDNDAEVGGGILERSP